MSARVCRLCLSEESLEDIFKGENLNVWILDFLSIVVAKDDKISISICSDCHRRLQEFREYQLRCLEVQDVLLRRLLTDEKSESVCSAEKDLQDVVEDQSAMAIKDEPIVRKRSSLAKTESDTGSKKVKCTTCDKKVFQYLMEGHLNGHLGLRPFKCERGCQNVDFSCRYNRQTHYRNIHGGKLHECDVCHKKFRNKACLYSHIKGVHSLKTFACPICNKGFSTSSRLIVHKKNHDTRERKHPCSLCSLSFFTNHILQIHMRTHRRKNLRKQEESIKTEHSDLDADKMRDDTSTNSGENNSELPKDEKHNLVQEEEKKLCSICDKIFPTARMEGHQNWHQGLRPFACERGCEDLDFHCRAKRMQHYQKVHGRFECDICHSIYRSKKTLRRHKQGVHAPKAINCSACNQKFTTSERLKIHTKLVHDREKNHKCPKCSKLFCFKYELNRHLKLYCHKGESEQNKTQDVVMETFVKIEPGAEAEELEDDVDQDVLEEGEKVVNARKTFKKLKCEKCDKMLLATGMEAHLNWHSGIWPYKCKRGCDDQCFRSDQLRQNHYRKVHDIDMCDICHKRFRCNQALKNHKISVHGEKIFKCFCGKSFSLKYRLGRHMEQVHKGHTNHCCSICYEAFSSKQDLIGHMEIHDKNKPNEEPGELEDMFEPGEIKIEFPDDDEEPRLGHKAEMYPTIAAAEIVESNGA